jgi:hypothetical protein
MWEFWPSWCRNEASIAVNRSKWSCAIRRS